MKYNIKRYLNKGTRMTNLLRQVGFSFIFKVIAMGCNFLLVPVTLDYLGKEQYGIWLTMLTILSWLSFCDLGLGNGLRNKVTIALAKKNFDEVKEYISSTYCTIFVFVGLVILGTLVIAPFLNWQGVFNTQAVSSADLRLIVVSVVILISINFFVSLINQVLHAYQKSSLTVLNQLLGNILALGLTCIAIKISENNLLLISIVYACSLIFANCLISCYFFKDNKVVIPSVHYFRWSKITELSGLSLQFFIIQIASMVLFTKDNVIITQVLGPEFVTPYNITYKLFNVVIFFSGIILSPLWSAFGDAYSCGDIAWIKNTMKKAHFLMLPVAIGIIILCLIAPFVLSLWVGAESNNISSSLIWIMGLFTLISIWNNIYATFLNATGKLKLLIYITILIIIVNIPLSVYFINLFGVYGVLIATISCMIPGSVISVVQYKVLLKEQSVSKESLQYKIFCR